MTNPSAMLNSSRNAVRKARESRGRFGHLRSLLSALVRNPPNETVTSGETSSSFERGKRLASANTTKRIQPKSKRGGKGIWWELWGGEGGDYSKGKWEDDDKRVKSRENELLRDTNIGFIVDDEIASYIILKQDGTTYMKAKRSCLQFQLCICKIVLRWVRYAIQQLLGKDWSHKREWWQYSVYCCAPK